MDNPKPQQPTKKPSNVTVLPRHDRLAPHDDGAEKSLIGSVLINPKAFEVVEHIVQAPDFFSVRHGIIWQAIQALSAQRMAIDITTINSQLLTMGKVDEGGGLTYMIELTQATATSVNVETYAKLVQRLGVRRRVAQQCRQLEALALNLDVEADELEGGIKTMGRTVERIHSGSLQNGFDLATAHMAATEGLQANGMKGVMTGIHDIDNVIDGIWPRSVMWVVGRPEMGKSAVCHTMALNAALAGKRVAFFNVGDASKHEVTTRLASILCKVPAATIGAGKMTKEQYAKYLVAMETLSGLELYIDSEIGASPGYINASAKQLHSRKPLDLVVMDYFQAMNIRSKKYAGRYEMLIGVAEAVTEMADEKHLNVPIIIGAQAGRAVDQRKDKQPTMSDIKGCGEAEQKATIVLTLYRPAADDLTHEDKGEFRIAVVKNKQTGRKDIITARFDVETTEVQSAYKPF